jgi:hypothetical protein
VLVGDGDVFAGVDVMQRDRAIIPVRDGALQSVAAERNRQRGDRAFGS